VCVCVCACTITLRSIICESLYIQVISATVITFVFFINPSLLILRMDIILIIKLKIKACKMYNNKFDELDFVFGCCNYSFVSSSHSIFTSGYLLDVVRYCCLKNTSNYFFWRVLISVCRKLANGLVSWSSWTCLHLNIMSGC
jgi:hypothetical protein